MTFKEKLERASVGGGLCVGIDPVPERLPDHLRGEPDGMLLFCELIIAATAPFAAAYKPNLAFFEALGREGMDVLEQVIDNVHGYAPHALLIGDGKRNDISSTAKRYAAALFDYWGFDAVTVNPYLGSDGILPFAEREDRGIYILAATSNPSAEELQDYGNGTEPLYLRVAGFAQSRWNKYNNLGLVVGATQPEKLSRIRQTAPSLPFLIPGVGAQGGGLETAVRYGLQPSALPGLINSSRGIIYASSGEDFAEKAGEEAEKLRNRIAETKSGMPAS